VVGICYPSDQGCRGGIPDAALEGHAMGVIKSLCYAVTTCIYKMDGKIDNFFSIMATLFYKSYQIINYT
jgi:hypothetical protein